MFACLYAPEDPDCQPKLLDCAYAFSPRVEDTGPGMVVLDISGTRLLFGTPACISERIANAATAMQLVSRVALSREPDAAVHAVRGFQLNTVIPAGKESQFLSPLPIRTLCPALAGVDEERASEIFETLDLWGIPTFGAFAALPESGIFERLGLEGVLLQKLAKGGSGRHLRLHCPPPAHALVAELEHPIDNLEPLLFILARLVNELCAGLKGQSLAAAHLLLKLRLESRDDLEFPIRLAVPTRDHKLLLKLVEVEIQARPPGSAVMGVRLSCEPARPRAWQKGLFTSPSPEPEKLEMQLVRIAKLVGKENAGSAAVLDTHRPQAFRIRRFEPFGPCPKTAASNRDTNLAVRIFRPAAKAEVRIANGRPAHVAVRGVSPGSVIAAAVVSAAGPWHMSGDWWSDQTWDRDEWDVELSDGSLCRIFFDNRGGGWFVEGLYD